jgi:hypothetical protein
MQSYAATIDELWDSCKKLDVPLPQKSAASQSSFCVARKKLDEEAFRVLNKKIIETYEKKTDPQYRWLGHRLFAVDGSKINLPRTCIEFGYTVPSKNSHYPQGLLSCLYQLKSKIPYDFDLTRHKNERTAARCHLNALMKEDVVVYDRGYFSFPLFRQHQELGVHAIFRLPEGSFKVIRNFFSSNETDVIVSIDPAAKLRAKLRKEGRNFEIAPIRVRLIKYKIGATTFCLGTTLLDACCTIHDFSDVYHERWGVEELYKISKRMFFIENFHGKTERTVRQELFAHFVLITMNRIFSNYADEELNAPRDNTPSSSHSKPPTIQTNFANCINVFARAGEGLLLVHEKLKSMVTGVFRLIVGRYYKTRPDRSYERKSMKPESKWRTSKKPKTKKLKPEIAPAMSVS